MILNGGIPTSADGEKIAKMLNADETGRISYGSLTLRFNTVNVDEIESKMSTISQHVIEWDLDYYNTAIIWDYQ